MTEEETFRVNEENIHLSTLMMSAMLFSAVVMLDERDEELGLEEFLDYHDLFFFFSSSSSSSSSKMLVVLGV